jgi:hypothetical protein
MLVWESRQDEHSHGYLLRLVEKGVLLFSEENDLNLYLFSFCTLLVLLEGSCEFLPSFAL